MLAGERDTRLMKAFMLNDKQNSGYLAAEAVANSLRVVGAAPTQSQVRSLPAASSLPELRALVRTAPGQVGLQEESARAVELMRLVTLLDISKTGYIPPLDLIDILRAGTQGFSFSDATELLRDPKLRFTHPKTGEIEIERFLRTLIS